MVLGNETMKGATLPSLSPTIFGGDPSIHAFEGASIRAAAVALS
jgi:hypothetical protein